MELGLYHPGQGGGGAAGGDGGGEICTAPSCSGTNIYMAVWIVFEGSSNDFGDGPKIFIGGGEGFVQPERINWTQPSEICEGDEIPLCGMRFMLNNPTMKDVDFQFSTTPDGTHAGGTVWETGITKSGTEGQANAYVEVDIQKAFATDGTGVPDGQTLYYFNKNASGYGPNANSPMEMNKSQRHREGTP